MDDCRRAKLNKRLGRQTLQLPTDWTFPADDVFIRRDKTTGNVLISLSDRDHNSPLWWRVIVDLLSGLIVFTTIVSMTTLSLKIMDFLDKSEPGANEHFRWYHFVAYGFDFALFVWYNVRKLYEIIHNEVPTATLNSLVDPSRTWIVFAKEITSGFFKTFAGVAPWRKKKQILPVAGHILLNADPIAIVIVMMRTTMSDEQIRHVLRSWGYLDDLIDKYLLR